MDGYVDDIYIPGICSILPHQQLNFSHHDLSFPTCEYVVLKGYRDLVITQCCLYS